MKAKGLNIAAKEDYQKRINKVLEYINNHLDEEMDLSKLAEISNFSTFHFHRIFKAFRAETLNAYVVRIRLETAARLLRYTDLPIETIAHNVGYEVPTSLSKAFKQVYNITPSAYRSVKNYTIIGRTEMNVSIKLKTPKIINIENKTVIYMHLTGEYKDLDFAGTFAKLWAFVKEQKLFTSSIEHIGVYHDDPKVTDSNRLRSDICLTLQKQTKGAGEIAVKEIEGGRYAVFYYQGLYTNLGIVYDSIYADWLPSSGYELRHLPIFEKYLNDPSKTEADKCKTEIYLPIK